MKKLGGFTFAGFRCLLIQVTGFDGERGLNGEQSRGSESGRLK